MLEEWGNTIVWALGACTAIIAIAEFYGGKELQAWIKAKLEYWWLRLSYVRVPNVGLAEAVFASTAMRILFGENSTSRRLSTSIVLALGFVVAGWSVVAHRRNLTGADIDAMLAIQFRGGLPSDLVVVSIVTFISLGLTYSILERSIKWCSESRFSTLYFLLALVASGLVSGLLLELIHGGVELFRSLVVWPQGPTRALPPPMQPYFGVETMQRYFEAESESLKIASTALFFLRIVLFVAFGLWISSGWLLIWLKLTIYRLFEAEKGALTVFSACLTAVAAGVKWWMMKEMT